MNLCQFAIGAALRPPLRMDVSVESGIAIVRTVSLDSSVGAAGRTPRATGRVDAGRVDGLTASPGIAPGASLLGPLVGPANLGAGAVDGGGKVASAISR